MSKRQWYRVQNQADGAVADIYIFDVIGVSYWGEDTVSAKSFLEEVKALPSELALRIHVNSPGGDPFEATAIHNFIRSLIMGGRKVEVIIEGLAASAATIVTSAGEPIKIASNALMMVHNPSGLVWGTAEDMLKMAEALETITDSIVASYRRHSQLSEEQLKALMDAETWMGANEAVANGFATEIVEPLPVVARFDPKAIKNLGTVPEKFRARVAELTAKADEEETVDPDEDGNCPDGYEKGDAGMCHLMSEEDRAQARAKHDAAPAADVLAAVEQAKLSTSFARELVSAVLPMDQVQTRIAAAVKERSAAEVRAKEIRALCATAKCPELADGYIAGGMPVADVKQHLTTITAKLDKAEVDAGLSPDAGSPGGKPRLDHKAIYAERNRLGKPKEG